MYMPGIVEGHGLNEYTYLSYLCGFCLNVCLQYGQKFCPLSNQLDKQVSWKNATQLQLHDTHDVVSGS